MVVTQPENHKVRAVHVKATWAKGFDTVLFMSSVEGVYTFVKFSCWLYAIYKFEKMIWA
jgi:hypothetical protein